MDTVPVDLESIVWTTEDSPIFAQICLQRIGVPDGLSIARNTISDSALLEFGGDIRALSRAIPHISRGVLTEALCAVSSGERLNTPQDIVPRYHFPPR